MSNATNKSVKERFFWSQWDALVFGFYQAIWLAQQSSQKKEADFTAELCKKLNANKKLAELIKKKPQLALQAVQVLPCAKTTISNFIKKKSAG
ncbi:MAG: hypothetical protein A2Y67_00320 [Candidatus Buchananbacteria bacterium RBG_13_39_9]|uniref:Uncharacterized protein n=1 Tax=Candidatus Buchananbacteria bacterium RBG_13_39_9 TaxID=1797531 RepID=A0A1G1XS69_9BACT|nr:MAG: hypothetical protein A2Y67_00320 [Candidatus Buchananbacteria bacterium RBG_13_39_9]